MKGAANANVRMATPAKNKRRANANGKPSVSGGVPASAKGFFEDGEPALGLQGEYINYLDGAVLAAERPVAQADKEVQRVGKSFTKGDLIFFAFVVTAMLGIGFVLGRFF